MGLEEFQSALAVVAHPDDIESLCGGLVALLRANGARVAYVLLTSGDKGSADPQADPRQVAARREAEQLTAAHLIGVSEVTFLRWPDGEVADDPATRAAIAREIRRTRPELLLTFDPWHPYTFHNDHRQCGFAALAAAMTLACRPGPPNDAPPHMPWAAWLFNTPRPNQFIDIATVMEQKIAIRQAHASQMSDPEALARSFRERAAHTGKPYGLALAETYREVRFPRDGSVVARIEANE
ncbi:MAG: PIG-L deacetylase family protein [Thermomicrobiales bacterium]